MKKNIGFLTALIVSAAFVAHAETEEHLQKSFTVGSGGKLVVDVYGGSIEVTASDRKDVAIDVYRKISMRGLDDQAREREELKKHVVTFNQEGDTVTVRSQRAKDLSLGIKFNFQTRYVVSVPKRFAADLKTSGGSIKVADLNGDLKAHTSGGSLKFAGIRGPINGHTSGGSIDLADSEGATTIKTSGGSIKIRKHKGDVVAKTSGGGISADEIDGQIQASTSGGSVSASLPKPVGENRLETSGGGINVAIPGTAALDVDAKTSGGSVNSELPVATVGDKKRNSLQGKLNGGGNPLVLRTSGGSIHLKKL